MALLTLKNVRKYYPIGKEKFYALNGIDVSFEAGELVSIMGESGSGKSTLMNVIGALDTRYEGEILVNGVPLHSYHEKQRDEYRKNQIGFIFQSFNLIPHLTVLENVTIAMTLANVGRTEKIAAAKALLTEVGLEDQMKKRPNQLSGGQKQRVAIARALINNPSIILADEPTGALDKETTKQILEIIQGIARKGILVIMVTHSQQVADISQRVVEMSDGVIVDDRVTKEERIPSQTQNKIERKGNLTFFSAIKLALENMRAKLARNILVAVGGSIGITSVILMLSVGDGVIAYLNRQMGSTTNPYVVEVNQAREGDQGSSGFGPIPSPQSKPFTSAEMEQLCQLDYVASCVKGVSSATLGANRIVFDGQTQNLTLLITMNPTITESNLASGSFPQTGQVMIGTSLADDFGGELVDQQVEIELLVGSEIIKQTFQVSGIFTFGEGLDQMPVTQMGIVYINYDDLQAMYEANGKTLEPTTLYLLSETTQDRAKLKQEVEDLGYAGSNEEFISKIFTEMISLVSVVLAGISGISLFVSAIMILVVLYISVVERTMEIGVLKAIGGRRKDIRRIFVSEAFLIGIFSGAVAVMVAYGVAFIANQIAVQLADTQIVLINPINVMVGVVLSIFISMIAGLYPAAKAAKLDPVDSLRHE